jgi:hypothetical protein
MHHAVQRRDARALMPAHEREVNVVGMKMDHVVAGDTSE